MRYMTHKQACTICCSPLWITDDLHTELACGHIFHTGCVDTWRDHNEDEFEIFTCPICRALLHAGFDYYYPEGYTRDNPIEIVEVNDDSETEDEEDYTPLMPPPLERDDGYYMTAEDILEELYREISNDEKYVIE